MKLVNVRLRPQEASMVDALRRDGVELSQLVREAIKTEYGRRRSRVTPRDVKSLVAAIHAQHPAPPGRPARRLDALDRRAFREAVARRVRRAGR